MFVYRNLPRAVLYEALVVVMCVPGDDRSTQRMHRDAHWYFGECTAGGRHLRTGATGQV